MKRKIRITESQYKKIQENYYDQGPWNDPEPRYAEKSKPSQSIFTPVAFDKDAVVFKSTKDDGLYFFYYNGADHDFSEYADREEIGGYHDGEDEYSEYSDDYEITPEVVADFVNDNLDQLTFGTDMESGDDMILLTNKMDFIELKKYFPGIFNQLKQYIGKMGDSIEQDTQI